MGRLKGSKPETSSKGFNQREGLDYQEAFSTVVKMITFRTVLALGAAGNWHVHQLDVYNAFLQGD